MDEQKKYEVIKALADHPDGNKDRAAMTLDCSKRHVNRMLKGYKEQGRAFFIHGNRGRQPSTTIPEATRNAVVSLYRTKYCDANFQHYSELLATHENIHISASSVAKILESHCILSPKATKAKKKRMKKELAEKKECAKTQKEADSIQANLVALEDAHPRRPRCAYFGELEQMDATPYEWIPGQVWHLHLAVDDATGQVTGAYFDTQETLNGYYHVLYQMLLNYGIPYKLFTLNGIKSVFETQPEKEKINLILAVLDERTVDCGHCIQFQRSHYRMLDSRGLPVHYRKGTKVMVIQAFDQALYCCVNDRDIYALEKVPEHAMQSKHEIWVHTVNRFIITGVWCIKSKKPR